MLEKKVSLVTECIASLVCQSHWGKNPHFIKKFTHWKSQFFLQNSPYWNFIFNKIHISEITFFTKFAIMKSHFSQNSLFRNLIFHKIQFWEISFFTQFTFFKNQILGNFWIKSWFLPQCASTEISLEFSWKNLLMYNFSLFLHARKDSIMLPPFLLLFQQPIYLWNHKSCSMLRGRELHEFIVTHRWIRSSWLIFSNSQSGTREHTGPISYQKRIWGARLASFPGPYLK